MHFFLSFFVFPPSFTSSLSPSSPFISLSLSFSLHERKNHTNIEREKYLYIYVVEPAFNCSSTCIFSIQLKYIYRENYQANGIENK